MGGARSTPTASARRSARSAWPPSAPSRNRATRPARARLAAAAAPRAPAELAPAAAAPVAAAPPAQVAAPAAVAAAAADAASAAPSPEAGRSRWACWGCSPRSSAAEAAAAPERAESERDGKPRRTAGWASSPLRLKPATPEDEVPSDNNPLGSDGPRRSETQSSCRKAPVTNRRASAVVTCGGPKGWDANRLTRGPSRNSNIVHFRIGVARCVRHPPGARVAQPVWRWLTKFVLRAP
jgi:hypothetical protein